MDATSLAEYLVTQGIPLRTAHHIVGTLVARCEKEGKHALAQLSVAAFNQVIVSSTTPHKTAIALERIEFDETPRNESALQDLLFNIRN